HPARGSTLFPYTTLFRSRRALIMGEKSFGKGSVQTVVQTGPDAALRLTTARYYTPSGRSVQAAAIDPDVVVPQLSDPDYKDRKVDRKSTRLNSSHDQISY